MQLKRYIGATELEYCFGAESILEINQELLAQNRWLHHDNVPRFIGLVGAVRAKGPASDRVKDCLNIHFVEEVEAAKAWLRDPATQTMVRDKVRQIQELQKALRAGDAGADIGGGGRLIVKVDEPVALVSNNRFEDRLLDFSHLGITVD